MASASAPPSSFCSGTRFSHYGRNLAAPPDGQYTLTVYIDPPTSMRHDEVNGRGFAEPVDAEFRDVQVKRGQG